MNRNLAWLPSLAVHWRVNSCHQNCEAKNQPKNLRVKIRPQDEEQRKGGLVATAEGDRNGSTDVQVKQTPDGSFEVLFNPSSPDRYTIDMKINCAKDLNAIFQNRDFRTRITSLPWSQTTSVDLCTQNRMLSTRITSVYGSQPSSVVLCMHNSDFRTRITSLFGSQTSSVDLCLHNRVHSSRITSLYGSQSSSVDLCKQNSVLSTRLKKSLWVPALTCGFMLAIKRP